MVATFSQLDHLIALRTTLEGTIAAASGWPERSIMVDCVKLLVDAIDTLTRVVTWEKDCKLIAHTDLTASQRVAVWDMYPLEDLGGSCDDYVPSKSANDFNHGGVGSHGSQMVVFNSVLDRFCKYE